MFWGASPEGDEARPRRRWPILVALALLLLTIDLARPPERQLSARALIAGIHLYRRVASPWMPLIGARCRLEPTCSRYAEVSIRRHGSLVGSTRTVSRLARCGPWTPVGTVDPPE